MRTRWRFAVWIALALSVTACASPQEQQALQTQATPPMSLPRVEAPVAFYIAPNERANTFHGGASSFTAGGANIAVPLGQYMEQASIQALRAAFTQFRQVTSPSDVAQGTLLVQARVPQFKWTSGIDGDIVHLSADVEASIDGRSVFSGSYKRLERARVNFMAGQNVPKASATGLIKIMMIAVSDMLNQPQVQAYIGDPPAVTVAERAPAPRPQAPATSKFPTKPVSLKLSPAAPNPDDVAVIIGNADYGKQGKDIPNVVPAYADAESFKQFAIKALGLREGNIIDLRDATGAQFTRVFGSATNHKGQLYDWVRPDRSRVYVYYAGHGAPGAGDGSAYLVPADADAARIDLNGYPLKTLYANLAKIPAKSTTVIVEACFSGASEGGAVISNASPIYLKAKTPDVPKGLTVISAGGPNQMASWEEDRSNSLFTKYYVTGMAGAADKKPYGNGDGRVTLTELDAYLKDTLTYYARRYYGRDQTAVILAGD